MNSRELDQRHAAAMELPVAQRLPMLEDVVRRADAAELVAVAGRARIDLTRTYMMTGRSRQMIASFAWLQQRLRDGARWIGADEHYQILWAYKWQISALLDHHDVPLERVREVTAQMREAYQRSSEGMQPVLRAEYQMSVATLGWHLAMPAFDAWQQAPQTDLSDCEACERAMVGRQLVNTGDWDTAFDVVFPAITDGDACSEMPSEAVAVVLEPLIARERADEAQFAAMSAWRHGRDRTGLTEAMATLVLGCARAGDLDRGVELFRHRVFDLGGQVAPAASMRMVAAGARLLEALTRSGRGAEKLSRPDGSEVTAADMSVELAQYARSQATLFDRRNRSKVIGEEIEATLSASDLPHTTLGPVKKAPPQQVQSRRELTAPPAVSRTPQAPDCSALASLSLTELDEVAQQIARWGGSGEAQALAVEWKRRAVPITALDEMSDQQQQAAARIASLVRLECGTRAEWKLQYDYAIAAFDAAGGHSDSLVLKWERALVENEVDSAALIAAEIDETGSRVARLTSLLQRLGAATTSSAVAQWAADIRRILAECEQVPRSEWTVGERCGYAVARSILPESTAADCDQALALLAAGECPDKAAKIAVNGIRRRVAENGIEAALPLAQETTARAWESGERSAWTNALQMEFFLNFSAGNAPEAEGIVTALIEVLRAGAPTQDLWRAQLFLANFLLAQGRSLDAAEVAEQGLRMVVAGEDTVPGPRMAVDYLFGEFYSASAAAHEGFGDQQTAITQARKALRHYEKSQAPMDLVRAGLQLGTLLADVDAVEAVTVLRAALARAVGPDMRSLHLDLLSSLVYPTNDADGLDAALRILDEVEAAIAAIDPEERNELGQLVNTEIEPTPMLLRHRMVRAMLYAGVDDYDASLRIMEPTVEQWEQCGDRGYARRARLLCARLRLFGGTEAALPELADISREATAEGDEENALMAARTGAEWLATQGRDDEAQAFFEDLVVNEG